MFYTDQQSGCLAANSGVLTARPVFILGIAERCGTTYLQDLLRLHPDCDVDGLELEEDHFLTYADVLTRYVDLVSKQWKAPWGLEEREHERQLLCQCLGNGLVSYLRLQVEYRRELTGTIPIGKPLRVLVTKTPDVTNLALFDTFFPNCSLIVLVRDGRAVVESAVRTFYRCFADEARKWATRAEAIKRFADDSLPRNKSALLVRYEDIYGNPEQEVRRILDFLQLDPRRYDFAAAFNLPVRGSSTLRDKGGAWQQSFIAPGIHWNPVPKGADFKPLERWSAWSTAKRQRFHWIAGRSLSLLGYDQSVSLRRRWVWTLWNIALDILPIEKVAYLFEKIKREVKFASTTSGGISHLTHKLWSHIMAKSFK